MLGPQKIVIWRFVCFSLEEVFAGQERNLLLRKDRDKEAPHDVFFALTGLVAVAAATTAAAHEPSELARQRLREGGFPEVASAGRFTATGSVLDVVQTGGVFGGNVRYEPSRGTIQVTSDCSGGSMTFALSGRPMLFDYYFADPNRIVLVGSIGGDIITGTARRFGTQ